MGICVIRGREISKKVGVVVFMRKDERLNLERSGGNIYKGDI